MFTSADRKRSDAILERISCIGEAIGDFLHANGKSIIKGVIFLGCIIAIGGIYLSYVLIKRTIVGKKR